MAEQGGITTMLPTDDAEWVGAELTRRFGMAVWSFTLSATDANRWALRSRGWSPDDRRSWSSATATTASVDETFAIVPAPTTRRSPARATSDRRRRHRPHHPGGATWNDLGAVERELAHGDVAAILTEPALTNIGIVLPEPRLPRRTARARHALRRPAHDRRDAHVLRRLRRRDPCVGTRARHPDHRQAHRRRHSDRRLRARRRQSLPRYRGHADAGEADIIDVGGRRRHARRQRLVDGGDARDPRRGAHPRRPSRG